ncbi:MAG TPA: hypothetical protein VH084_18895 [Mycobacterium sp.]|nr:hypothetical protein [Mycobacterium sp.]
MKHDDLLDTEGGTCSTPDSGTRMGRNQTVPQRETPIELARPPV